MEIAKGTHNPVAAANSIVSSLVFFIVFSLQMAVPLSQDCRFSNRANEYSANATLCSSATRTRSTRTVFHLQGSPNRSMALAPADWGVRAVR